MSTYGTNSRPRRLPAIAAVVVAVAVIGVIVGVFLATRDNSSDLRQSGGITAGALKSAAAAQAGLPKCADLFRAGQRLDFPAYSAGCLDPSGRVQQGGWSKCTDGRILVTAEGTPGIPDGYGYIGDVWHPLTEHPIGADPGYAKVYTACG